MPHKPLSETANHGRQNMDAKINRLFSTLQGFPIVSRSMEMFWVFFNWENPDLCQKADEPNLPFFSVGLLFFVENWQPFKTLTKCVKRVFAESEQVTDFERMFAALL